ncbi:MAG: 23S rRNA (adenine(2503)-C(2))-methyltransferase RlmN [Candidatus Omnitrophota bacterium]
MKPSLYNFDDEELKQRMLAEKMPAFRARQVLDWIYQKRVEDFGAMKNLPKEQQELLAEKYSIATLERVERLTSSNGESLKYLFRAADGQLLESVLILQKDRATVCVSTQIGCKIGCAFCASGKGKFVRDLSPGEIVEQVLAIERAESRRATNIVFMGMGEPLDNFEATMKALKIFQAPWGLAMGSRRITVSTSGITPKIVEFVERNEGRVRLSVSLHATRDELRTRLVPVNKRYPLDQLLRTLHDIRGRLKRDITFEYTLIHGVNDSKADAEELVRIAKGLGTNINLIPCNPIEGETYGPPDEAAIAAFRKVLYERGVRSLLRQTAGRDITAACGQLRLRRKTE